jgi:hypothetical protein
MRVLVAIGVTILSACADVRQAKIDGAVRRVSAADIAAIGTAMKQRSVRIGRSAEPIFRIHIVDHDTARVYCGEHYGYRQAAGIDLYVPVERAREKWIAADEAEGSLTSR